jgi:hypothetical protein
MISEDALKADVPVVTFAQDAAVVSEPRSDRV